MKPVRFLQEKRPNSLSLSTMGELTSYGEGSTGKVARHASEFSKKVTRKCETATRKYKMIKMTGH
ncbi:hypothetical protein SESBI_19124 [Sesbania bispinosa]|nr:hypothetical protein SESBI_19124 [Sesbania bispinosa]